MSGVVAAWKRIVAERQMPRVAREAKTADDAIRIVKEAIGAEPTLTAMGHNRLDEEEALELTGDAMDAARVAVVRSLVRRRIARKTADGQDEAFVDELVERLRERGEL